MKASLLLLALLGVMPASLVPATATATDPAPNLESFTASGIWATDYEASLAAAQASGRLVLLNFTGSDWCVWCQRLREQILSQKPFLDYARERLVLVEVDFPEAAGQPASLKAQNQALKERYAVTGYPTVIFADADGRELGRTGYMQGGPKTFVRELKRLSVSEPKMPKS